METKLVKDSMSKNLITIGWRDRMESAYRRMQSQRVRHLPVVNDSGEIIGMISDRDVQRSMISQIDRPMGRIVADETIEFDVNARVCDYMSWPAKTVDQDSELKLVAERMIQEKVSSLLVCKLGTPVGIVTAEDLIRVLIDLLADPKTPARWTLEQVLAAPFQKLDSTLI